MILIGDPIMLSHQYLKHVATQNSWVEIESFSCQKNPCHPKRYQANTAVVVFFGGSVTPRKSNKLIPKKWWMGLGKYISESKHGWGILGSELLDSRGVLFWWSWRSCCLINDYSRMHPKICSSLTVWKDCLDCRTPKLLSTVWSMPGPATNFNHNIGINYISLQQLQKIFTTYSKA